MKFLDLTGLQYFYDKYLRPLKDAAFKNTANNLTTETEGSVLDARQGKVLNDLKLSIAKVINNLLTTEAGFALDARQGKVLDDKITELNGNLNGIHFEVIESERYYVKKYENGYFESDFKTQLSPSLGNPLTFQALASGQTIFYRARITNMGIGIKVTEMYSLELTAQNAGIIWPVSPSMNANMEAVDTFVIQQGNDNTRTTTIRGRVTGKWK